MSFDLVRRSLKNLFLYDKQPSKEPLKQESVSSQFTLEPNMSSYSQNKFTAIQKKKERFNPYKFALQRLVDFHQKSSKIKDHDKLPVIQFVEQKSEKKVKTKMIHPRWNHDESSSECMGDSLHLRNSFAQNQVESHSFHNQPSASKQDIQPYYVQPAKQQVTYKQSLQAHLKQVDIDKTRFRNVTIPPRSIIQFQRDEQQQSKLFEKSESPQIKNTREQIGPQLQKITKAVESKQDSPVPTFPPLVESKIIDQNPKQSVNKFLEIKKLEIPLSFKNEEPIKIEKQSTAKEDITKVETQPTSPEKPKQVPPQPINQINEIPAPQVTQILPPQPTEQPTQNQIIQPQTTSNPFLLQPTQPLACPWINQPQAPAQTFNVFQPVSIPQPVSSMPFQNQNQAPNLFQSQNLFPQQLQQENQSFISQFPQSQNSNPMFNTNNNNLCQQQPSFPNTQSIQQQPLFQFQQPPQQQSQSQSPFAFQTNSLGGGSFSAADQNQPKPILDLFPPPTATSGNSQQVNLFGSFNDKPVQQNQNNMYKTYKNKLQDKGQQRME